MDLSLPLLVFLFLASGFAGLVDSLAGGGGLVQLPALLVGLPNTPTATILGTNKIPSFFGTTSAAITFIRRLKPDIALTSAMALPAFIGAMSGASVAALIPKEVFRPIILVALICVASYTWRKKELGLQHEIKYSHRIRLLIAVFAGLFIGFYDGIFGPGTGSFLLLILVATLGYAFLQASVTAKIVNWATNFGAVLIFGFNSQIIWMLGLIMATANISGAIIGARLALKGGSTLIRKAFLLVTCLLIIRLGLDIFVL